MFTCHLGRSPKNWLTQGQCRYSMWLQKYIFYDFYCNDRKFELLKLTKIHCITSLPITSIMCVQIGDEADALDVVLKAKEAGVVVAVGHAKPHAVMLRKAVDAGCSYVIHLGNGPTGSSWKSFNDGGMMV